MQGGPLVAEPGNALPFPADHSNALVLYLTALEDSWRLIDLAGCEVGAANLVLMEVTPFECK